MNRLQRRLGSAAVDQPLQVVFAINPCHRTGRILPIIPDIRIKSVCIKNDRTLLEFLFQTVRVKLSLLLAYFGILTGPLCFDDRQRAAIITEKDVVSATLSTAVRHAANRMLLDAVLPKRPACVAQIKVYVPLAGGKFAHFVDVEVVLLGVLRPQLAEFCAQRRVFSDRIRQLLILLSQRIRQRLQFVPADLLFVACGKQRLLELAFLIRIRVAVIEPGNELVQIVQRQNRFFPFDAAAGMRRHIAQLDDVLDLREQRRFDHVKKAPLVDQAGEVVLIGNFEFGIRGVQPLDRQLQCTARQNRRRRRTNGNAPLRLQASPGKTGKGVFRL